MRDLQRNLSLGSLSLHICHGNYPPKSHPSLVPTSYFKRVLGVDAEVTRAPCLRGRLSPSLSNFILPGEEAHHTHVYSQPQSLLPQAAGVPVGTVGVSSSSICRHAGYTSLDLVHIEVTLRVKENQFSIIYASIQGN